MLGHVCMFYAVLLSQSESLPCLGFLVLPEQFYPTAPSYELQRTGEQLHNLTMIVRFKK